MTMYPIRREVFDLITLDEKIQSVLAQGDQLTEDEKGTYPNVCQGIAR